MKKLKNDILLTEEQKQLLRTGTMYTSMAYMLMECADQYLMTSSELLAKVDCVMPIDRRTDILMAKSAVQQARDTVTHVTKPLYNCGEADLLIDTSDWLLDCVHEIVMRTNSNAPARQAMLEYIKKYKRSINVISK
jgi:hypothetical protein